MACFSLAIVFASFNEGQEMHFMEFPVAPCRSVASRTEKFENHQSKVLTKYILWPKCEDV
jgi:hypothetical protein